jgi:ATP-binding cassette, subfamily B, bacterial
MWRGGGAFAGQGDAGLPFSGIPEELRGHAQKLLDKEPEHPRPQIDFDHRMSEEDRRPFTLRRFFSPHKGAIALALVLVAIEVVTEQIGPFLLGVAIDRGVRAGDGSMIAWMAALFALAVVGNYVTRATRIAFTARLGQQLLYRLRVRLFAHYERQSLDYYTGEKSGRILSRMTSDVEALQALFTEGLVQMVVQAGVLVFVVIMLFTMNPTLALILLVGILPPMVLLSNWFRKRSDVAFLKVRDRLADLLADLSENLAGMRLVKVHNRQRHNSVRHRDKVGEHLDANLEGVRYAAWYQPGMDGIGIAGQLLVLLIGARFVANGQMQIGEVSAFVLYVNSMFAPIQHLVQQYTTYQKGRAAIVRFRELFATEPTVREADDAHDIEDMRGEIELEDVSFGYKPDEPVITDVDLHLEAGEVFALVGPTGAGKSTIAKLISRFHDPTDGVVRVDGHDLREVTLQSLRSQMVVVPQEPFLFATSIRENIAFARPDISDEQLLEACRAVGIEDLIERLPEGLDTHCHERGVALSSGERQLIALARAFVAQPKVLILDEATSNLDLGTESKVEAALDVLLEGRTAILIAHRLSTAMRADRIAVVDDGHIAELGSHDELIAEGGRYARLFETWVEHGGHVRPGPNGNGRADAPQRPVGSTDPRR